MGGWVRGREKWGGWMVGLEGERIGARVVGMEEEGDGGKYGLEGGRGIRMDGRDVVG